MPTEPPLVTCVMPTRDRRGFVAQALACFLAQDYPALELVVVDDGRDAVADLMPDDPRVRYLRLPHTRSIGAKRNIAVQGARGEIVVGWDDDDWHGPGRISAQTAPLLAGTADLTGLGTPVFLDTRTGWFWECDDPQWCLFAGQVIGGTLAFPRSWWLTSGGFPDTSLGEDVHFAAAALRRHARLVAMPADGRFLCVRHPGNTWGFDAGGLGDHDGRGPWRRVPPPDWLPEPDRGFYERLRPSGGTADSSPPAAPPAVATLAAAASAAPVGRRRGPRR
ncbi:glycosyltransferase family 2 protein [Kitasatospora sp. CM 4170]|uniref:Glycosyltransferase family 2 protein n=1 Tax=Kitasatospora aburaviensis TaxID=67265 RepID=A0ABW1ES96_9ACTN|nr:glycosyltransferase family 2 protein [Kitasatospora sp. CM 4170]WNM44580.1 glycosyltransferase family 2 protein [Kitasatospora sp. CM 4170]